VGGGCKKLTLHHMENGICTPLISPKSIRAYPKAVREQKLNKKGRQKGESAVLTDTPEKNEIEKKFYARAAKRNIFESDQKQKAKK